MNKSLGTGVFLLSSVLAAIVGTAHADSKVRVDKADVDFGKCRTFAWHSQTDAPVSLTDQRVRAAVMSTLAAKGYKEAAENPDCRVAYVFSLRETSRRSGPSVGVGVGGGSGRIGGGIGIGLPIGRKKQVGTMTIDIIDASKNAQIWSGSLDDTFKSAELSETEAKQLVLKVLAEYPNRAALPSK